MARTPSTMLPLGTKAPYFHLPNVDGRMVSIDDFRSSQALLVAFICNHCPFVKHVAPAFAQLAQYYQGKGVAVVAINSNDASTHPGDSPEQMVHEAENRGYTFPYLYDDAQEVAKSYKAACTPDFFLFDKDRKLVYRGQMDDSRPDSGIPVTGRDLRARSRRSWLASRFPSRSDPASAAISNGRLAMSQIIMATSKSEFRS